MNKRIRLAKEIQRIAAYSGKQVIATKFQFSTNDVYVDENYLMVNLPKLEDSLKDSVKTLEEVKEEFIKTFLIKEDIVKEDKHSDLSNSSEWEIAATTSATAIGIRLEKLAEILNIDKKELETALRKIIDDNHKDQEYEDDLDIINRQKEEISKLKEEQEELKRGNEKGNSDDFRKEHGKEIMKELLEGEEDLI